MQAPSGCAAVSIANQYQPKQSQSDAFALLFCFAENDTQYSPSTLFRQSVTGMEELFYGAIIAKINHT